MIDNEGVHIRGGDGVVHVVYVRACGVYWRTWRVCGVCVGRVMGVVAKPKNTVTHKFLRKQKMLDTGIQDQTQQFDPGFQDQTVVFYPGFQYKTLRC